MVLATTASESAVRERVRAIGRVALLVPSRLYEVCRRLRVLAPTVPEGQESRESSRAGLCRVVAMATTTNVRAPLMDYLILPLAKKVATNALIPDATLAGPSHVV